MKERKRVRVCMCQTERWYVCVNKEKEWRDVGRGKGNLS